MHLKMSIHRDGSTREDRAQCNRGCRRGMPVTSVETSDTELSATKDTEEHEGLDSGFRTRS
jgi:hypothetical protein